MRPSEPARRGVSLAHREALWALAFLIVPLAFFLFIRIWPAFQALWLSLFDWHADPSQRPFVGLEHYHQMLDDRLLLKALQNTLAYTLLGVPLQLLLGLCIALLLNAVTRFRDVFRAIYFAPYVTPAAAIAWVFSWMLSPNFGIVNEILGVFGIPPQPFLTSPSQALATVTMVVVWQNLGFQVVLFLAGLQNIPRDYYEAARIDGANNWQLFRHITLPLLNPVMVFSAVIGTIGFLQLFTQVVNLNFTDQGGPLGSTLTLALYIYQQAFARFDLGYAAAITVLLFVIILVITLVQLRLLSRRVEY
ncbi:carbohydrate ABC transporter permease [Meiothermus ruber]|jgi:multiple sugar transport system permease protein|uniref:Binding-protein-dependent transport system inner membrane protein n=1 Tax=Meiothermus ruber (strain ATCC 35948 / DSM 1279 / VKM B-1258 / 21) TaxID=504728 RepID=D3PKE4_MEIRD|nr:sugar ABC transporter permease [Meiothermus ruber]ADD26825.1 binding-protein-dependent transport systems inner membrane component [Meiothermus ruber DSM 1279]AGK04702.1 binding-protein-dependent transport system inner membrane protein [Meiothermus ruber DSM 1279]MCL6529796.1 sugar ABC transporter permease [Meiothermus ruber]GAO73738.1 binding-protein-dependent transport system inner membrane protein [Meiothermus ruber H328]